MHVYAPEVVTCTHMTTGQVHDAVGVADHHYVPCQGTNGAMTDVPRRDMAYHWTNERQEVTNITGRPSYPNEGHQRRSHGKKRRITGMMSVIT